MNDVQAPRIEDGRALLIAGLAVRFTMADTSPLPAVWRRFNPLAGTVANQVSPVAYGVCYDPRDDGSFGYIAGVEVTSFDGLGADVARLALPAQRYAVFTHRGPVATVKDTYQAIYHGWLPGSLYQEAPAPNFERYDQRFDGRTGLGGFEIWIPIRS